MSTALAERLDALIPEGEVLFLVGQEPFATGSQKWTSRRESRVGPNRKRVTTTKHHDVAREAVTLGFTNKRCIRLGLAVESTVKHGMVLYRLFPEVEQSIPWGDLKRFELSQKGKKLEVTVEPVVGPRSKITLTEPEPRVVKALNAVRAAVAKRAESPPSDALVKKAEQFDRLRSLLIGHLSFAGGLHPFFIAAPGAALVAFGGLIFAPPAYWAVTDIWRWIARGNSLAGDHWIFWVGIVLGGGIAAIGALFVLLAAGKLLLSFRASGEITRTVAAITRLLGP